MMTSHHLRKSAVSAERPRGDRGDPPTGIAVAPTSPMLLAVGTGCAMVVDRCDPGGVADRDEGIAVTKVAVPE